MWEKQVIEGLAPPAAELRHLLEQQIRQMVESGHLLPYYCKRGELNARWYFTNPGDTIAALARPYPYLSTELQHDLRGYLDRELQHYPPCSGRVNAPFDQGTSRMDFTVPEHLWEWSGSCSRLKRMGPGGGSTCGTRGR